MHPACPAVPPDLAGHRGPCIHTRTGRLWYPHDPQPWEVALEDLMGLGLVCRFGGQVKDPEHWYSNLEHCVRVGELLEARLAPDDIICQGLGHDLHEVYPPHDQLGPVVRDNSPFALAARALSKKAAVAVRAHLGLPPSLAERVRMADRILLATERRDLMTPGHEAHWAGLPAPLPATIEPRPVAVVVQQFHSMWKRHGGGACR